MLPILILIMLACSPWAVAADATLVWQHDGHGAKTAGIETAPLTGFNVYQAPTQTGAYMKTDSALATDRTLTVDMKHIPEAWFKVTADASGAESLPAGPVQKVVNVLPAPGNFKYAATGFTWMAVAGAVQYMLNVHEAGTPYDCATQTFCKTVTTNSAAVPVTEGKTYDAWLYALDAAGLEGEISGIGFTALAPPIVVPPPPPPPTGPAAPTDLHIIWNADGSALLSWALNTAFAEYQPQYRAVSASKWTNQAKVTVGTATFARPSSGARLVRVCGILPTAALVCSKVGGYVER